MIRVLVIVALGATLTVDRGPAATPRQIVNVAPVWGTRIEATSSYSPADSAQNVADGSADHGHGWLSADNVSLPQSVTLRLAEPFPLVLVRLHPARWGSDASMYRTREFRVEVSTDGDTFEPVGTGSFSDRGDVAWESSLEGRKIRAVRVVVLSSYNSVQTCGFGEVELLAALPEDRRPTFEEAVTAFDMRISRGLVNLRFELDPPATIWRRLRGTPPLPNGTYESGAYELRFEQRETAADVYVTAWHIRRTDGKPFVLARYQLTCRTGWAGVYRLFNPCTFHKTQYGVDLPFHLQGASGAENHSPLVWMHQPDGLNTLTLGLLDQVPQTNLEGWTASPEYGGEVPGIANSYVRVQFTRSSSARITSVSDGLYLNAGDNMSWHEALSDYSRAVDAFRKFRPREHVPDVHLNAMWNSWFAHADAIDETQIREDARRAALLGVKTIEVDAGWNIPPGVGYGFAVEGDYRFDRERFPDARGMIDEIHESGQAVVVHVSPLLMGPRSRSYAAGMRACVLRKEGKETMFLDPRLTRTHQFLLSAWEDLFRDYDVDGLWYDFLELPHEVDPPPRDMEVIAEDLSRAYTLLLERLYELARREKDEAVIILRRGSANHNAKRYCTHVWPTDTPQDYNANRRDIVYLKTLGAGVLTHAECTSWTVSESDLNVARQMASLVLAGVPSISVNLAESPPSHDQIIRAWLDFYDRHRRALVLGSMAPLLPVPASAAIRIESGDEAFFGLFEAAPGLLHVTRPVRQITIVNAFSDRIVGRLEGIEGVWRAELFDFRWKSVDTAHLATAEGGLNLNLKGSDACFTVVLTRQ